VGDIEIGGEKNESESLAISVSMAMQRYGAERIAQWSTSWASLKATGCGHQVSACAVLPRRQSWSTNLL
jgi:hypothetical protein